MDLRVDFLCWLNKMVEKYGEFRMFQILHHYLNLFELLAVPKILNFLLKVTHGMGQFSMDVRDFLIFGLEVMNF